MPQSITEEVKKQAEQRISSRIIVYVRDIHDLAQKIPNGVDAMGICRNFKNSKEQKDFLDSAQKYKCRRIVDRYLTDEQHQKA